MCSSSNGGVGLPTPYRILEGFINGVAELLADSFFITEDACCRCASDRTIDLLAQDEEEVVGMVVD